MRKIWSFKELKGLIAAPALSRLSSWGSSMNICEYLRHLRLATAGDPKCEGRRPKQIRIAGNGAVDKLQSQRDSREFPKAAGDKNVSQTMCGCFPLSSSGGEGWGEEALPAAFQRQHPAAKARTPHTVPSLQYSIPPILHPSTTPSLHYSIPPLLHSFPRKGADRRRHRRGAIAAAGGDEIRRWTSPRRDQRPSQMFLWQSRTCNT